MDHLHGIHAQDFADHATGSTIRSVEFGDEEEVYLHLSNGETLVVGPMAVQTGLGPIEPRLWYERRVDLISGTAERIP